MVGETVAAMAVVEGEACEVKAVGILAQATGQPLALTPQVSTAQVPRWQSYTYQVQTRTPR